MRMTKTTHITIANNVKRLMEHKNGMTQAQLASKTGLSQKTISNVLKPGSVRSITTETIDQLSKFFNLEPYHLLIPNLPIEELLNRRIEKIVECYAKTNQAGREKIQRIAENEMRYCSPQSQSIKTSNNI